MHRPIIGYGDITIRADRQALTLLGIAIDIDNQLVAGAQHIVLRRGDVHLRLEGQVLVVKDITAKDFLTRNHIKIVTTRLRQSPLIAIEQIIWSILTHLLLTVLTLTSLFHRRIILAHPVLGIADGTVDHTTHARLLELTGIFLAHLLNLLKGSALLQQLGGYLLLRDTGFLLLGHILEDLTLRHALRISPHGHPHHHDEC